MNKLIIKPPHTCYKVYTNSNQFRLKNYTMEVDLINNCPIMKDLDMMIWKECVLYISDNNIAKNHLYVCLMENILELKYLHH